VIGTVRAWDRRCCNNHGFQRLGWVLGFTPGSDCMNQLLERDVKRSGIERLDRADRKCENFGSCELQPESKTFLYALALVCYCAKFGSYAVIHAVEYSLEILPFLKSFSQGLGVKKLFFKYISPWQVSSKFVQNLFGYLAHNQTSRQTRTNRRNTCRVPYYNKVVDDNNIMFSGRYSNVFWDVS